MKFRKHIFIFISLFALLLSSCKVDVPDTNITAPQKPETEEVMPVPPKEEEEHKENVTPNNDNKEPEKPNIEDKEPGVPKPEDKEPTTPETEDTEENVDSNKTFSYIIPSFNVYDIDSGEYRELNTLDHFFLTVTKNDGSIEKYLLGKGDTKWWELDKDFQNAQINYNDAVSVEAIYAPSYKYKDDYSLDFIQYTTDLPGNYYVGKGEVLKSEGVIDRKNRTITFNFNRDYTQLKIKVNKNQRLRVNITSFTAPDFIINDKAATNSYSDTILSGDYIYLYGKWDENSRIQIINQKWGKLNEVYNEPLPIYKEGESVTIDCSWVDEDIKITDSFVHVKHLDDSLFYYGSTFPGTIDQGTDNLCWAASISQCISWWLLNNEKNGKPFIPIKQGSGFEESNYNNRSWNIYYNVFRTMFKDNGYTPDFALRWYLDGTMNGSIRGDLKNPDIYTGGYFSNIPHITDLVWNINENYNFGNYKNDSSLAYDRLVSISKEIYGNLKNGQPMVIVDSYYDYSKKEYKEHAIVIWGAEFDTEKQIVTYLKVSDSNGGYILPNHDKTKLGTIEIKLEADNEIYMKFYNPENPYQIFGSENELLILYSLFPDFSNIKYITD